MKHLRSILLSVAIVSLFVPNIVFGQATYPKEPIRLVITHTAGGTTDMAARLIRPIYKNI